jgi:hypothetical protein
MPNPTRKIYPFDAQIYIFASTILGALLWLGLVTRLSWSSFTLSLTHYFLMLLAGWRAFALSRGDDTRLKFDGSVLLANTLLLGVVAPVSFFWSYPLLGYPAPERITASPNRLLIASLYRFESGFALGTKINVQESRLWLPGVVENLGVYGYPTRHDEASVMWVDNSAVKIGIGERVELVRLNMFQWYLY